MIVNIKFLQRTISLEQHFHTTDSQITDVSKLNAVTKSKLLSLEKEVSFSNFWFLYFNMYVFCYKNKQTFSNLGLLGLIRRPKWSSANSLPLTLSNY